MLWSCRFSVEIWKETERQINERFRTNIEIKYHNVIMRFNPENFKNYAAINTIIMAVKKRICYKDRLKTHDPARIRLGNSWGLLQLFKVCWNALAFFYLCKAALA